MLKAHDKEIIGLVTDLRRATYVCFCPEGSVRNSDNSFFILDYDAPADDRWEGIGLKAHRILMNNRLSITEYANGVSSDQFSLFVRMKWTNPSDVDSENGSLAPVQDKNVPDWSVFGIVGRPTVSVSDTEISVSYSYRNVNKQAVAYRLQICKATRHFVETLDWKNPCDHYESSGSCAAFGLAAPTELVPKSSELYPMSRPRPPTKQ